LHTDYLPTPAKSSKKASCYQSLLRLFGKDYLTWVAPGDRTGEIRVQAFSFEVLYLRVSVPAP